MESVLVKLAQLMGNKSSNLIDLSRDTAFLRDELCAINALLKKLDDEDELDPQVKDWSNQVRELGYDIEDCIDEFVLRIASADAKAGFAERISRFIGTLRACLETAKQIKELKTRLQEINERRKRYRFEHYSSSSIAVDPRLPALYKEAADLVGVDGPRDELIRWVMDEKRQLKGVTIVGFGGLGKTTLANEVYRGVKGQFDCHAFVSVSQRPDMTRLLNSIRLKLGQQEFSYPCEVKDLIDDVREYLQHKRYLVVIDDLWDTISWDAIKCAFPENNLRSRFIVTTRIESVARVCGTHQQCLYRLKPLSDQDSRRLLFSRTFSPNRDCTSQIKEVSAEILKKCGGLPLAIITVARLLASRPTIKKEDWEKIQNSLCSEFGTHPTMAGMRLILSLSYRNLPHHLKTCFLCLGTYPEDHIIQRSDLVRQWVAEGFVNDSSRQDSENLANSYFDELVNRSMIQPEEVDCNGEVLSCRVHDMMLDLILSKCTEDNFITVVYNSSGMKELHNSKPRRLSLNLNGAEGVTISTVQAIGRQSQIRSLALFGDPTCMPACAHLLPQSKFLRVLVLQLRQFNGKHGQQKEGINLTDISQLVLLRFLKVEASSSRVKLPMRIQGLRHLETLEMCCGFVGGIPTDVFHLPGLLHLDIRSTPGGFPDGISNAKSLLTLKYFGLTENSLENIHGLGELTSLRYLKICCFPKFLLDTARGRSSMDALRSSLGKLGSRNLRYLSVVRYPEICADMLSSLAPPPRCLEKLDLLAWYFSRVPRWLAELHDLCSLDICVREVVQEDVGILGELRSLMRLQFQIQQVPKEKITIRGGKGFLFPALVNLQFWCQRRMSLQLLVFEAGAMPNLRRLGLETSVALLKSEGCGLVGIEHLLGLKEICVSMWHGQCTESEIIAAECALRNVTRAHSNHPTIKIDKK
ncbi:unnamed protein product [Urochloa decumbens]|uniref:Uncharacterized protein n=1 Tax=Urochloa decumbens TaxID=240449 RepID=A0ABC9ESS5_9POAL